MLHLYTDRLTTKKKHIDTWISGSIPGQSGSDTEISSMVAVLSMDRNRSTHKEEREEGGGEGAMDE